MRGRINLPPDAVIALVQAVKANQKELRDHSKFDNSGWTVRTYTWKTISDQLNARYSKELTVEQCMKKFTNIKTMIKYKLEEEARKRQLPGFENFSIRLTGPEREYLRCFTNIEREEGNLDSGNDQDQKQGLVEVKEEEEDEENGEEDDQQADVPPNGDEGHHNFREDVFGGGSLTEAILNSHYLISDHHHQAGSQPQSEFGLANDQQPGTSSQATASYVLMEPVPLPLAQLCGGKNMAQEKMTMPEAATTIDNGRAIPKHGTTTRTVKSPAMNGTSHHHHQTTGQKRKHSGQNANNAFVVDHSHFNGHAAATAAVNNIVGHGVPVENAAEEEEDPGLRLKRLKCELIEMQKLELLRREEWRLKKEFMVSRQTAALENVVILLRAIRDKSK